MWLGECYLDDPMAANLRSVVLNGVDPESIGIRGIIQPGCEVGALRLWAPDKNCHVAYSSVVEGSAMITLKIFDVFSAVIVVSEDATKYARGQFDPSVIRFVHTERAPARSTVGAATRNAMPVGGRSSWIGVPSSSVTDCAAH
jgi:hypothetical protein